MESFENMRAETTLRQTGQREETGFSRAVFSIATNDSSLRNDI
jgi:hypothetical protein